MTKLSLTNDAFNEMALAGYVFTLQAEDFALALTTLEALVSRFDVDGIELNWPYSADLSSVDGSVELDIPAYAYSGIVAQLAIDLCASFGKDPKAATLVKAKKGYETMLAVNSIPNGRASNPSVPIGSGNKGWRMRRVFMPSERLRRTTVTSHEIAPNTEAKHE